MTVALPLKAIITVAGQTFVWANTGDALPKDYYIERRLDGGLRFGLGGLVPISNKTPTAAVLEQQLSRCYHLGAHHIRVEDSNGVPLFDKDITDHWWNARWAQRPAPLQAKRPWSQNIAERFCFPMGQTSIPLSVPGAAAMAKYLYTGPMGTAGMMIGMPVTGERPEIGVMSDMSAFSVLGISDGPMLACGDASLSCPIFFRDESTGQPIDLFQWPLAEAYDLPGYMGWPYLPKGPRPPGSGYPAFGGGWVAQQAHYYEMAYFAYIYTLDEDFLLSVQYGANFVVLTDGSISLRQNKAIPHGEYRGIAWAFRSLFMAHAATALAERLGILPPSAKPSSYFKALLDNALAYYGTALTDPARQAFRNVSSDLVTVGGRPVIPPWQENYMLLALAEGVLTGHLDWVPLYLWALQSEIALTDGSAGVPPGYGSMYYVDATQPDWKSAWLAGVAQVWNPDGTVQMYLGGAEAPTPAELAKVAADPFNGYVPLKGGMEPLMVRRAVFVQAQYLSDNWAALGLPGKSPRQMYPSLDNCVATMDRMLRSDPSNKMDPRDSFVVPAQSQPLPPAGAIHMSKLLSLKVGESGHVTVSFDDGAGGPSKPGANLAYTVSPVDAANLVVDATGYTITRLKPVDFTVTANADGASHLTDVLPGAYVLPLAGAVHQSVD